MMQLLLILLLLTLALTIWGIGLFIVGIVIKYSYKIAVSKYITEHTIEREAIGRNYTNTIRMLMYLQKIEISLSI